MQRLSVIVSSLFLMLAAQLASAQASRDVVWVQIEARPTYNAALERIETYSETLPNVSGFALQGGWYAITLGPFGRDEAEDVLRSFRQQGRIPNDSYIALSSSYGQQYWPPGADVLDLGSIAAISGLAVTTPDAPTAQSTPTTVVPQPMKHLPKRGAAKPPLAPTIDARCNAHCNGRVYTTLPSTALSDVAPAMRWPHGKPQTVLRAQVF